MQYVNEAEADVYSVDRVLDLFLRGESDEVRRPTSSHLSTLYHMSYLVPSPVYCSPASSYLITYLSASYTPILFSNAGNVYYPVLNVQPSQSDSICVMFGS
jgi:hypothetical protein